MHLNKRVLILENFYPLQTRSLRIENSLKNLGYAVDSVLWNRNGLEVENNEGQYVHTKAAKNKLQKLFGIYHYYRYLIKLLKTKNYDILIAVHWDMLFLCSILKVNKKLIYDNLDMPTHKFLILRRLFRLIELIGLRNTDAIIFASRFFKDFYNDNIPSIIFENKPSKSIYKDFKDKKRNSNEITISFFGTLRYLDILKNLIDAVGNFSSYNLIIKGSGFAEDLVKYIKLKAYSNVVLEVGWYDYNDLGKLFSNVDLIWAAYPNRDFNVKYAISNKFFESLIFNKPCIFSEKTKLGTYIEKEGLGFTVNPYSTESIRLLLEKIRGKKLINQLKINQREYIENSTLFWEDNQVKLDELISLLYKIDN